MLPACPQNHFVYPNPSSRWCHTDFVSHQMSPSAKKPVAQKKKKNPLDKPSKGQKALCHLPLLSIHSLVIMASSLVHRSQRALGRVLALSRVSGGRKVSEEISLMCLEEASTSPRLGTGFSVTTLSLQQTVSVVSHHRDSKSRSLVALIVKWPTARHCCSPAVGWSLVSAALRTAGLDCQASETQLPSQRNIIVSRAEAAALYNCPESSRLSIV